MIKEIDARGLACPQPVILTKKALDDYDKIVVIVDNETARENVKRMAASLGCEVSIAGNGDDIRVSVTRGDLPESREDTAPSEGKLVIAIASDKMGRGDDELGNVLMKSFIHTTLETSPQPDTIIFFNTGVRLTTHESQTLDDIKTLAERGVNILVCGTCLSFFDIKDKLATGVVSNMYDIAEAMIGAERLVYI